MILTHLAVRHTRGIRTVRLGPFSERLNLLYGPNESGKSTLVEALRFGLFERSMGEAEHKRSLRSWGQHEAPEIEVSFEDDAGEAWTVYKRFLDRPSTELAGRNTSFKGEDAERRLRALLGTHPGNRHGVTDADLGIWPLLWVRQGEAARDVDDALNDDGRSRLIATLADHTGATAIGPKGRAWLARARDGRDALRSPTGQPRGAWKEAVEAHEAAGRQVDDLRERRAAWDQLATDVAAAEVERDDLERRRSRLDAELHAARRDAAHAALHEQIADAACREVELLREAVDRAEVELGQRQERTREHARAVAAEAEAAVEIAAAERELARQHGLRAGLRMELSAASAEVEAARARLDAAHRAVHRAASEVRAAHLRQRIADAAALESELVTAGQQAAALRIQPDLLEKLEVALRDQELEEARAEAAAVTITLRPWITPSAGALISTETAPDSAPEGAEALTPARADPEHGTRPIPLSVDGHPVLGPLALRFSGPGELRLDGVATLSVQPGEGLADRAEALAAARARVARCLSALDAPTAEAARVRADTWRALLAHQTSLRGRLRLVAPEGASPLQAELAGLQAELDVAATAPTPEDAAGELRAAEARLAALRSQVDDTSARDAAMASAAHAKARLRGASTDRVRLEARLANGDDASAAHELANHRHALEAALTRQTAAASALREAGGDGPARRVRELDLALEALRARSADAARSVAEGTARLLAQAGLAEDLALAEESLASATARRAQVEREAAAAHALADAMEASLASLQDRFTEPVRQVITPWVEILFPGSDLAVDPDSGQITGLRTGSVVERFEDLSAGAREQLAILVRLGIGAVLAGPRRLPVILDDALVNADPVRRARMLAVLREACRRLQILVFTCHDADFDLLGADWSARVQGRPARG